MLQFLANNSFKPNTPRHCILSYWNSSIARKSQFKLTVHHPIPTQQFELLKHRDFTKKNFYF